MHPLSSLFVVCTLFATTAHAGPKNRQTARIMSGTAAAVSGAVAMTGFLLQKDGDPYNAPVLYTGIGLLAVTPSPVCHREGPATLAAGDISCAPPPCVSSEVHVQVQVQVHVQGLRRSERS